jgi:hypothetical protein
MKAKDPAWKDYVMRNPPAMMREERQPVMWKRGVDGLIGTIERRVQGGLLDYATVTQIELSAPRCTLKVEYTSMLAGGGRHVSAAEDVAWVRDGATWYIVPKRP